MTEPLFPFAVAVRSLTGTKLIDGGDTVDVRFTAADGRLIAVLIPHAVFAELQTADLAGCSLPREPASLPECG